MVTPCGRYIIVYNGCVYNFREIGAELRTLGVNLGTHCDTEVVLAAYAKWGKDCLQKFNGMFAFAIWDTREKRLFAARDRLGIKPFYWTVDQNGAFIFGSEIKAITTGMRRPIEPDMNVVGEYLAFQMGLDTRTMFKDIQQLAPGHFLDLEADRSSQPKARRWWDLSFATENSESLSTPAAIEEARFLVEDAVRIRLVSDVSLGSHLSGGLDSSAVACLASRFLGGQISTFTGRFDEPGFDELPWAEIAAKASCANQHIVTFSAAEFRDEIASIIHHLDEPAAGPGVFPQFLLSRLAAKHVKVVLGGQGGDEVFGGYARYLVVYLEECLKGAIFDNSTNPGYVATLSSIVPNLKTLEQYVPMLRSFLQEGLFDEPAARYFRLMNRSIGIREMLEDQALVDDERNFEHFRNVYERVDAASTLNRMLAFDLQTHIPALLQVEDRTSMAAGLESRVPLLDHRIIEFMGSTAPTTKLPGGRLKHILREAVRPFVPNSIVDRTDKLGFPVPLGTWLSGELRTFLGDHLLGNDARTKALFKREALEDLIAKDGGFNRTIWGILCIELWMRNLHNLSVSQAECNQGP